jgi:hypothetical protein
MQTVGTGSIITKPASKEYLEGWERIFGKKDKKSSKPESKPKKKKDE